MIYLNNKIMTGVSEGRNSSPAVAGSPFGTANRRICDSLSLAQICFRKLHISPERSHGLRLNFGSSYVIAFYYFRTCPEMFGSHAVPYAEKFN